MTDLKVLVGAVALALFAGPQGPASATTIPYAPVLGAQPEYREIKDWVLACDNTHACFAKYDAADDGSGGGGYLSVARDAGPNGKLAVTIRRTASCPAPAARAWMASRSPATPGPRTPRPRPGRLRATRR
jgi:hypothetical protein